MPSDHLFDPVSFRSGTSMKNRFMLAPLTNEQSHADGRLSEEEHHWLVKRAEGGFGLTMTAASHVASGGQGFAGQLGCFSDDQLDGLSRLAANIKRFGSLSVVQLHHAGMRSPVALTGHAPRAPFDDHETGAKALNTVEVHGVIEAFVEAAARCQRAGFDGVEIHGAHGYLLCEFLDAERNTRTDGFGGDFAGRSRIFFEIIDQIRERCGPEFFLALRVSPERFGVATADVVELCRLVMQAEQVDMIDLSLWDTFKNGVDAGFEDDLLAAPFLSLERGETRLAVAGHLYGGEDVLRAIDLGADVVAIGRAAITNHNLPELIRADQSARMRELPVSVATLRDEGLSDRFVDYMRNWRGFVED